MSRTPSIAPDFFPPLRNETPARVRRIQPGRAAPARCALAAIVAVALATACTEPAAPRPGVGVALREKTESGTEALIAFSVPPRVTDPSIDKALADHLVFLDPDARSNHRLLVFLPGTSATPARYQLFQREGARLGYHVIGLMFENSVRLATACPPTPDPAACYLNARLEILDGVHRSAVVTVSPANSIDNLLTKLLRYLVANRDAEERWAQFLDDDGAPRWQRIVVAGHSQGGGEAVVIARRALVARVVTCSSPPDDIGGGTPPAWLSSHVTPAKRYYGLAHRRELLFPAITASWALLGMGKFGPLVRAEGNEPPYERTHTLFTEYASKHPHGVSCYDRDTPLDPAGTPLLRDAWRYLLGASDKDHDRERGDG